MRHLVEYERSSLAAADTIAAAEGVVAADPDLLLHRIVAQFQHLFDCPRLEGILPALNQVPSARYHQHHSLSQAGTHSPTHSLINSPTHPLIHSCVYQYIHALIHLFIHPPIHLPIQPSIPPSIHCLLACLTMHQQCESAVAQQVGLLSPSARLVCLGQA